MKDYEKDQIQWLIEISEDYLAVIMTTGVNQRTAESFVETVIRRLRALQE